MPPQRGGICQLVEKPCLKEKSPFLQGEYEGAGAPSYWIECRPNGAAFVLPEWGTGRPCQLFFSDRLVSLALWRYWRA